MEKRGEKFVVTKKTFTLTFELLISELKDTPAYRRLVGKKKCTFSFFELLSCARGAHQLSFYFIRPLHENQGKKSLLLRRKNLRV